jgi:hypothetical protein
LEREAGVEDVGGGEAEVEPAAGGPHGCRHDVDERGDVVARDRLTFRHGLHREHRARPAGRRIVDRHRPQLGECLHREQLDLEPVR